MNLNKVYLSLGSNLGDKIKNLQSAINLIDTNIGDVLSISNVYQTKSEGFKEMIFLIVVFVLSQILVLISYWIRY